MWPAAIVGLTIYFLSPLTHLATFTAYPCDSFGKQGGPSQTAWSYSGVLGKQRDPRQTVWSYSVVLGKQGGPSQTAWSYSVVLGKQHGPRGGCSMMAGKDWRESYRSGSLEAEESLSVASSHTSLHISCVVLRSKPYRSCLGLRVSPSIMNSQVVEFILVSKLLIDELSCVLLRIVVIPEFLVQKRINRSRARVTGTILETQLNSHSTHRLTTTVLGLYISLITTAVTTSTYQRLDDHTQFVAVHMGDLVNLFLPLWFVATLC
ncbi:hypothetical protein Btru_070075 [Bulinus truncatus]|nr:hypothetical protein Btru_070075 [Bulinus truncatus]